MELPGPAVSPCVPPEISPQVYTPDSCQLPFDTVTGPPLLLTGCTTRVPDNLRSVQENHAELVEATSLPMPAYASARSQAVSDIKLLSL